VASPNDSWTWPSDQAALLQFPDSIKYGRFVFANGGHLGNRNPPVSDNDFAPPPDLLQQSAEIRFGFPYTNPDRLRRRPQPLCGSM